MRLFVDTNIFMEFVVNTKDFKNADQQRIEILTPAQFVQKYISQDEP